MGPPQPPILVLQTSKLECFHQFVLIDNALLLESVLLGCGVDDEEAEDDWFGGSRGGSGGGVALLPDGDDSGDAGGCVCLDGDYTHDPVPNDYGYGREDDG